MTPSPFDLKRAGWPLLILLSLAAVFAWVAARNHGLYPVVFADEMLYSAFARLTPLAEASIPSYLYLSTYSLTNACGTDFLSCTRLLNTVFLVAAGPFIYLTARLYAGKLLAGFIMLMCLLGPINSYTSYFMPESMYFFAFAVVSWVALTRSDWHWSGHAVVTGALLGVMTLVKVHAVFLVPALSFYMAWLAWPNWRRALGAALLSAAAAMGVKYAVGYAIAGEQGLYLFGSLYGNQASNSAHHALSTLLAPGLISLRGHLMVLALLYGLPMALLAQGLFSRSAREQAGRPASALRAYALLMLGAAFGMTVVYTATITDFGPREGLRLHMRYYSFVFPLLLIVAASAIGTTPRKGGKVLDWAVALALVAACMVAAFKIPTYFLNMVDGPDIASLHLTKAGGLLLAALNVVIVLAWAARWRGAALLYLCVLVPALTLNYQGKYRAFQSHMVNGGPFDQAGLAVRDLVPRADRKDITLAGTGLGDLMRAKFHIDDRDVTLLEMADGAPYDLDYLPVKKKWLVVVGPHALPPELTPTVRTPQFALVKIGASHQTLAAVALNGAPTGALLAAVEGLAGPESWGSWSNAKEVVLRFKQPLPKQLNVLLTAKAFGPNAEQPFTARVGEASKRFRVPATSTEVFLHFDTDGKQDTLRIEVPQPVAPASLGKSVDTRTLGIGLIHLEIGTRPN